MKRLPWLVNEIEKARDNGLEIDCPCVALDILRPALEDAL